MKLYIPLSLLVGLFIFLKLTSLGVRVSDTNVYFYTAYEMLQGKSLYKDIFFTNFPLFMYISSLYITLTGGNIYLYYFTAVIEVAVTATIIHLIVRDKTEKVLPSTLASSIYLFSYLILATSDHQTGVFLGSVFAVLSYYFYTKKKYFLTGGFVALMILTKAYFLPVALSYFFILPLSLRSFKKPLVQFLLGGAVIGSIILLPTLLTSFSEFYRDIVEYSLIRPQGISKTAIFTALLQREFLFVLLWGISIFLIKKYRFYGALSVISALFFLFYKDFYFYYFNLLAPFLCIFAGIFINHVENKYRLQKAIIPTLLFLCICINMIQYFSTSRSHVLTNYQEIISVAKTQNQPVIYGTNDIAPLLAYETKKPLLQGVVDTNPTLFRKGVLNKTQLTKAAIEQKALFVGHGIYYPEYNIRQDLNDEVFDLTQMTKCSLLHSFPAKMEGYENRIILVRCP